MRSVSKLRAIVCLLCVSCMPSVSPYSSVGETPASERWAIYRDYRLSAEHFSDDRLVVFDRVYYPDFRALHKKTIVLAYINGGEVLNDAPERVLLKQEGALFPEPIKGRKWAVDLNSERWRGMVMKMVEDAVSKGFAGIMLDRMDSSLHAAGEVSTENAADAKSAAVSLIDQIHEKYPAIKIMLNQSLDILPDVADKIDYVLAEAILTNFNLSAGQSRLNDSHSYQQTASALRWARNLSPSIKIYTLDYWNANDVDTVKKIYRLQREQGFSPYVTTPDLRHYTPEPK